MLCVPLCRWSFQHHTEFRDLGPFSFRVHQPLRNMVCFPCMQESIHVYLYIWVISVLRVWVRHDVFFSFLSFVFSACRSGAGVVGLCSSVFSASRSDGGVGFRSSVFSACQFGGGVGLCSSIFSACRFGGGVGLRLVLSLDCRSTSIMGNVVVGSGVSVCFKSSSSEFSGVSWMLR